MTACNRTQRIPDTKVVAVTFYWKLLDHPFCGSYFAVFDCHLFGLLKKQLVGGRSRWFDSREEVEVGVHE
jgi:hypothetical protein